MEMKREYYLDLAKSVAVYLVVVHHVRDYAGDPAVYAGMAWIENLSSLFNVAVFFAIVDNEIGYQYQHDGESYAGIVQICSDTINTVHLVKEVLSLLDDGIDRGLKSGVISYKLGYDTLEYSNRCQIICDQAQICRPVDHPHKPTDCIGGKQPYKK